MRKKVQVTQRKCIRFCLKLKSRQHIGDKEFKKINRLPKREKQNSALLQRFLIIGRGLPHYMYMNFFSPPKIRITRGHICLWRYL